jgi:hypothetical protein
LSTKLLKNLPRAKVHFIEPMYAKAAQNLPEGKNGGMKSSLTMGAMKARSNTASQ